LFSPRCGTLHTLGVLPIQYSRCVSQNCAVLRPKILTPQNSTVKTVATSGIAGKRMKTCGRVVVAGRVSRERADCIRTAGGVVVEGAIAGCRIKVTFGVANKRVITGSCVAVAHRVAQ